MFFSENVLDDDIIFNDAGDNIGIIGLSLHDGAKKTLVYDNAKYTLKIYPRLTDSRYSGTYECEKKACATIENKGAQDYFVKVSVWIILLVLYFFMVMYECDRSMNCVILAYGVLTTCLYRYIGCFLLYFKLNAVKIS